MSEKCAIRMRQSFVLIAITNVLYCILSTDRNIARELAGGMNEHGFTKRERRFSSKPFYQQNQPDPFHLSPVPYLPGGFLQGTGRSIGNRKKDGIPGHYHVKKGRSPEGSV